MNIIDLRSRMRTGIGNPTTTAISDATLDIWINAAYKDIVEKNKFHKAKKLCRFDTIAGQDKYSLPTDCAAIIKVRDRTNEKRILKQDLDATFEITEVDREDAPVRYTHIRDWIQFSPTPDSVYNVEVYYRVSAVATLSDSNTSPIIPESWHEGIVMLARHKYFDDKGDLGRAIYTLNLFKDWLRDKPSEIVDESRDDEFGVRIPSLERGLSRRIPWDEE